MLAGDQPHMQMPWTGMYQWYKSQDMKWSACNINIILAVLRKLTTHLGWGLDKFREITKKCEIRYFCKVAQTLVYF